MNKFDKICQTLVTLALEEDIFGGDITSESFISSNSISESYIVARDRLCISGLKIAEKVFNQIDNNLKVSVLTKDGKILNPNDKVINIHGKTKSILAGERIALNFLQHLSGIATLTHSYVDLIKHCKNTRILDTRKTTPAYRLLEKQAVVHGGGVNHRMGLFDGVMVKDNHLASMLKKFLSPGSDFVEFKNINNETKLQIQNKILELKAINYFIILEADRIDQFEFFLNLKGVDVILLDNMSIKELNYAIDLRDKINPDILLEASGGVTLETVKEIAETGVDRISIGALTHSAKSVDLGLDFID